MTSVALFAALVIAAPFPDLAGSLDVVPTSVAVKGKAVAAARWTDKVGLNVVVLTETARAGDASGGTKRVYGYHFVREGSDWRQLWRIADAVEDCEFDLTLDMIGASLSITDLDGNGTAESTFAYVGSCRSDVSPDELKVLMHEGAQKYALRGSTRVQIGEKHGRPEFMGGERKPDRALAARKEFLAHAQKVFDASGGK